MREVDSYTNIQQKDFKKKKNFTRDKKDCNVKKLN